MTDPVYRPFVGVLAELGRPSIDGRVLDPEGGSLSLPPLPLMAVGPGRALSLLVGTIDEVRTLEDGRFDTVGRYLYGRGKIEESVDLPAPVGVVLDEIDPRLFTSGEPLVYSRWRLRSVAVYTDPDGPAPAFLAARIFDAS